MISRMLALFALVVCSASTGAAAFSQAPQAGIDPALAAQYFEEARVFCLKDDGVLWGVKLDGPLLFADRRTRSVVANQSDGEGRLKRKGNVFVGTLPESVNIANTSVNWAGVKWTMIAWPLPADAQARARLMAHEIFHRVQDELGLPGSNPSNDHLDTLEGRLLLRLEWRALKEALGAQVAERGRRAIEDALVFRARRRELFQTAAETERGLEMNEGLAEYTGVKLCGKPMQETLGYLRAQLDAYDKRQSFARSFAYMSGPAYGVLLDETGKPWRKGLSPHNDLGKILQEAWGIKLPAGLKQEAERRSLSYEGELLLAEETRREEDRKQRAAEYRNRFVEGPVLILPLTDEVQYAFDPNNVEVLEGFGTVYPTLRVSDAWGILEVRGGALMLREGQRVTRVHVDAPKDTSARPIAGNRWTLRLNDGWRLVPAARPGDYSLKKDE